MSRPPKTMRAAVVREFGKPLGIEEVPVPVPGPGEVLVKVAACGVCHTAIVGTRRDLDEAIAFAARGKVKAEIHKAPLEDINEIFTRLKAGRIEGRMVLDFTP